MVTLVLDTPEATERLGGCLGRELFAGAVVALDGPLGAGKTHLTRGLCAGLGVPPTAVSSPTYILIQEYAGRLPVYHFDVYRLATPEQFSELGVEEYLYGDGVCCVEWASRVMQLLPEERIELRLDHHFGSGRILTATATDSASAEALAKAIVAFQDGA